jgi:hypothetical protein
MWFLFVSFYLFILITWFRWHLTIFSNVKLLFFTSTLVRSICKLYKKPTYHKTFSYIICLYLSVLMACYFILFTIGYYVNLFYCYIVSDLANGNSSYLSSIPPWHGSTIFIMLSSSFIFVYPILWQWENWIPVFLIDLINSHI